MNEFAIFTDETWQLLGLVGILIQVGLGLFLSGILVIKWKCC